MTDTIFTRDGAAWVPTPAAGGPWGATLHGGAPAALVAHALETAAQGRFPLARLTIDLFRPVPPAPLEVSVRSLRSGRRLCVHEAVVARDGTELLRATALHADETPFEAELPAAAVPLPEPTTMAESSLAASFDADGRQPLAAGAEGLHVRLRVRRGEGLYGSGHGAAWMHLPLDLAPGVPLTPTTHLAAVSDFANGISQRRIDTSNGRIGFINADISLHLMRAPITHEVGMVARNEVTTRGRALVSAECWDADGLLARVTQTSLAMPAPG